MALALSLPPELPHRDDIVTITFAVVAFSVFAQGLTIAPLLRRLGQIKYALRPKRGVIRQGVVLRAQFGPVMTSTLQILVLLLAVIAAVAVMAKRLQIPPSILLVLTGVILALIPGLPPVNLAPHFMLLFVLPPIVYSSAVAMSWREFRFNLRPISLLAVGCVLFTTLAVAAATHAFLASLGVWDSYWGPLCLHRTLWRRCPLHASLSYRDDCW